MIFRYDIAALRALAVISVIFYHFKIFYFTGGLIGVDIFFVLSGFLMTRIIFDGFDNNTFKLLEFYKKRVYRIIPSLLFLILILSIFSFLFLFEDIQMFGRYALVSEIFVSNYFYLNNSSYFDDFSQNNLLLHTWSLGVEWQFYMLYPIVLLALKNTFLNRFRLFILIYFLLISISIFSVFYHNMHSTNISFFSFHTRAWEMLAGGLVCIAELKNYTIRSVGMRKILSLVSFGIILLSCFLIDDKTIWPSGYTFFPVAASCLILLCNVSWSFYKFSIVQYIAKLSYSLYLWHWPLYVILIYFGVEYSSLSIVFLIITTFIFAVLSYRFIEINRNLRSFNAILLLTVCLGAYHFFSFKILNKELLSKEREYQPNIPWEQQTVSAQCKCNLGTEYDSGIYDIENCLKIDENKKNVLLLGDSHAGSMALSLKNYFNTRGVNFVHATFSGNAPLINRYGRSNEFNRVTNYLYKDFFVNHSDNIDLVIVELKYVAYVGIEKYMFQMKEYFDSKKIKIIFLGQTEQYHLSFEKVAKLKHRYPSINIDNYVVDDAEEMNVKLKKQFDSDFYIDIYTIPGLNSVSGNKLYMYDNNHLSKYGADKVISYLSKNRVFDSVTKSRF